MSKKIIIYYKEFCPYCIKLFKLLDEKSIKYEKLNIDKKNADLSKIKNIDGHYPVPQVILGNKVIHDYSTEEELVKELQLWIN